MVTAAPTHRIIIRKGSLLLHSRGSIVMKALHRRGMRSVICDRILPAISLRNYTAPTAETAASPSTNEATLDPLGLTKDDVFKIYRVPNKETKEVFPHGLKKSFVTQIDCFKETSWILRSPTYDILSKLKENSSNQNSSNKFLIYGGDGCGKSICLNQVVHWCWKAGWMVIHVPGIFFWAHSRNELRASVQCPGMYDQPHEASHWLKNFRSINAKTLKSIRLSEPQVWSRREQSEEGEELGKVIELALHKPVIATDVMGVVLKEVLKEEARQSSSQDNNERLKLMLAVDEFNGCYNPCAASITKFEQARPEQLNLLKYFKDLIPVYKFPGPVVLSLSRNKMFRYFAKTPSPLDVLGNEGMREIAGYKKIEVENFSREEMLNLLEYYQKKHWITKEPYNKVCEEVWHLSEGNPAEIYKLSCLM